MSAPLITPTRGESLFIARRRKGLNQIDAAAARGVHPDVYRAWETDQRTHDQPYQRLGALQLNEVCVVVRRRAKKTQREVAKALGCTRVWVNRMETGMEPAERLREYWGV